VEIADRDEHVGSPLQVNGSPRKLSGEGSSISIGYRLCRT
jgi:hypothetical protein